MLYIKLLKLVAKKTKFVIIYEGNNRLGLLKLPEKR